MEGSPVSQISLGRKEGRTEASPSSPGVHQGSPRAASSSCTPQSHGDRFGRGDPVPQQQCPPTLLSQSHNSLFCSTIFSKREENTFLAGSSAEGWTRRTCGYSQEQNSNGWKVWVRDGELGHLPSQKNPSTTQLGNSLWDSVFYSDLFNSSALTAPFPPAEKQH